MTPLTNRIPRISIVMPVYNASRTIADTLRSVFAQTRTDFEVILVDDGSTDTAALSRAISPWRDSIRYFRQPNAGAGAARNVALAHASGRYIAFLDADDGWEPEFLERQVRWLETRRELDMVWSDGWIRGDTPLAGLTYFESTRSVAAPAFQSLVRQTCSVLTSAVVVRKTVFDVVGGFDIQLRRGQDFDLWLRMAHRGIVMAARTVPLVWRRVHERNLSGDTVTELQRAIGVLNGIQRKLRLDDTERALVQARLAQLTGHQELELGKRALHAGDLEEARSHLSRTQAVKTWKVRAVMVAMRISPALLRQAYLRTRALNGP